MGEARGQEGVRGLRGARWRRQRWCHQGHDRKGQPARFPRRCHGRPDGAREVANVCSAIPAASSFRRGDRDLRPQSWYNRAGVERVMGFCTEDDAKRFLSIVPSVEKAIVESGIVLLKLTSALFVSLVNVAAITLFLSL